MRILRIGKNYEHYGKLASIHLISGERYYFFIKRGGVTMIPASAIVIGRRKK